MSSIEAVKKMMGFSENTHMCDISEITEDHIHLESWNEDVPKSEFDEIPQTVITNHAHEIEELKSKIFFIKEEVASFED